MKVDEVPRIAGALLFRPVPHVDERGFFSRTFDREVVRSAGIDPRGSAARTSTQSPPAANTTALPVSSRRSKSFARPVKTPRRSRSS